MGPRGRPKGTTVIKLTDEDKAKYTVPGDLPRSWEERAYRAKATHVAYWVNVGVYKFVFDNVSDAYACYSAEADSESFVSLYRATGGGWGEQIGNNND